MEKRQEGFRQKLEEEEKWVEGEKVKEEKEENKNKFFTYVRI